MASISSLCPGRFSISAGVSILSIPLPVSSRRQKLIFAACDALRYAHRLVRRVSTLSTVRYVAWVLACYADQVELRALAR